MIMTGGPPVHLVGPIADKVIRGLRVNTLFTGAHSSFALAVPYPQFAGSCHQPALIYLLLTCASSWQTTKWDSTSLSLLLISQIDTTLPIRYNGPRWKQTSSLVEASCDCSKPSGRAAASEKPVIYVENVRF